ncbi:hypothetical protein BJ742DRAFT_808666 [Cladochytrium replicatum]|nr:hypothetical protein BJ742DRAFT_808666 [Cladochytrium replicatum]
MADSADKSADLKIRHCVSSDQARKRKAAIRAAWERKCQNSDSEGGMSLQGETSFTETIQALLQKSEEIETVRKERVFDSEITEEENEIIKKRVAIQQLQFREYERRDFIRKFNKIRSIYPYVHKEEVELALRETNQDEDAVIMQLTQKESLHALRKMFALQHAEDVSATLVEETAEQREANDRLELRRTRMQMSTKRTSQDARKRTIKFQRLHLDDALKKLEEQRTNGSKNMFEGWSEARKKAYKHIKTNPNSYYYRFNAPGEKQRNGPWTKEERNLFFRRLDEVGADGQWGVFSMTIPGRVGYQCSNFYRGLLKRGQITDPNYFLDEQGVLHYRKDSGSARANSKTQDIGAAGGGSSGVQIKRIPSRKRKKSKYADDDDDGEDDSGNFVCNIAYSTRRTRSAAAAVTAPPVEARAVTPIQDANAESTDAGEEYRFDDANPLPGFTDPITLDEVVRPAISPYGHVMSYESWVRCLASEDRKNICPLTKRTLTKRELVILTFENIHEFRDKIVNS